MSKYIVKKDAKIHLKDGMAKPGDEIELTEAQHKVMSDLVETSEMAVAMRAMREKEAREAEAKAKAEADIAMRAMREKEAREAEAKAKAEAEAKAKAEADIAARAAVEKRK